MWIRFGSVMIAAWLVASQAAAGQAAPKPPANDDCLACHGDRVDSTQLAASTHGPLACVDCHADLAKTTEFPHPEKLAKVRCAGCHDDVGAKYKDSIHSWAKEKAGLAGAPACADCHGTHDVRAHTDAASHVFHTTVPAT